MVEIPRLQAKRSFNCREATCHSGPRAGIQENGLLRFWIPPDRGPGQAYQVRYDETVDFNQPILEPLDL